MKAAIRKVVLACFNRVFRTRITLDAMDSVRRVADCNLKIGVEDLDVVKLVVDHQLRFAQDDIPSIRFVSKEAIRLNETSIPSVKLLLAHELHFDVSQIGTLKTVLTENLSFGSGAAAVIRLVVQQALRFDEADVPSIREVAREKLRIGPDNISSVKLVISEKLALDSRHLTSMQTVIRQDLVFSEDEAQAIRLLGTHKGLAKDIEDVAALGRLGSIESIGHGFQICYAQEGESLILDRYFNYRSEGFYVDVGAHHPRRFSNTYSLYQRGWRGISIDPNPGVEALFEQWRSEDIFVPTAVSNIETTQNFFLFDEPALNTFSESLASEYVALGYKVVEKRPLTSKPLSKLLSEYEIPESIDFMSIDVEDHELQVLESNDWTKYRPKMLLVEILNFDFQRPIDFPVHQFILNTGYVLFAKTCNTIFYKDGA